MRFRHILQRRAWSLLFRRGVTAFACLCGAGALLHVLRIHHPRTIESVRQGLVGGVRDTAAGPSPSRDFLPAACHRHVVEDFPVLASQIERGQDAAVGGDGGEWSACTHIKNYGFNFAAFFARHLAHGLKPASVLEFGCGLGTTADFLARSVPGGSRVVCVEPEHTMVDEIFGAGTDAARAFPLRPLQLRMLSFAPDARACADGLYSAEMGFELVLSLEVAEHVPAEFADELVRRLAGATSKYLVFAAARPGQGGTGHLDESMHDRAWWIERFTREERGGRGRLRLLPQLSRTLRHVTGFQERAYDLGTNLVAFGAPGVADVPDVPQIAHDCFFLPHFGVSAEIWGDMADREYAKEHDLPPSVKVERPCPKGNAEEIKQRAHWVEGQAQALWPELDLLIRRVRTGELKCG